MASTKIMYCEGCQKDVEASVVDRRSNYTFKGETFEIDERVLMCDCGQELYDEILDTETMKTLSKMYQDRIGLSLEEIKSIRTQYGLSMDLFSRILGWSKATIVRYESGKYLPDSSHMSVLKRLKEHPEAIDEYYKLTKHKFTEKEQEKINEKLSSADQQTVEKGLVEALHINYKLHEKTIDSGYSSFDLNKLINMILFFASRGVQKTKLMKLLFYTDFLNYKRNLLSMSGMPYVRLPYGPVPKDHDLLLSTIQKNEMIDIEYEFINDYTIINIKSLEEFDDTLFNEEELEILHQVDEHFKLYGSVAISDFSHEEEGWKNTEDREIISYDYADTLRLD
ncbi:type II TA system antitoxin MqsA family protein [Bacillus sp. SLBN-46]|uniref:type II TA system antitoxin MqsA family protein n=1 Tax=Bacillus sp. SLBN-46 TaxID=3042283 RepID=UPI00286BE91C|nr:type II TA system antitoxin MqsA family protein [Bacillus sp. SLBN-46]